jgi:rubrerythrin
MRARLDVRDVILYAVRGEKAAFAAYTSAAARAAKAEVAGILNRLARDELGHLFTLLKRFGGRAPDLLDAVDITLPVPEAQRVERLSSAGSVRDVLREAVRAERESLAAYGQLAVAVSDDARTVLQTIMRRERRHVGQLEGLLRRAVESDTPVLDDRRAH